MKKIKFGAQRTISNGFDGVYGVYLIPTIELAIDREGNGSKPNKINIVSVSLSWLKWNVYMTITL